MSDHELNEFQRFCFGVSLDATELDDVKRYIRGAEEGGVTEGGVTVEGFLHLHALFIRRGRIETTWTVLRKFGYDDGLALREDYLHPPCAFLYALCLLC